MLTALRRDTGAAFLFGSPAEAGELMELLAALTGDEVRRDDDGLSVPAADAEVRWLVEVAAYAHGWTVTDSEPSRVRLRATTT